MAASKESIELLHEALSTAFVKILNEGVKVMDKDGTLIEITPGANYYNVIRQFINDNGIQCTAGKAKPDSAFGKLISLPFAGSDHPAHREGTEG